MSGRDEKLRQIDRLVHSPVLQGSESLCKLLRYLADHALEHPGEPVKEQQIALEVFGRPGNFDPRLDSTVRVQTGRLRTKLTDYYHGAGATDSLIVEIPRGTYQLAFATRPSDAVEAAPVPEPPPAALPQASTRPDRTWFAAFWAMTLVAAALGTTVLLRSPRQSTTVAAVSPTLRHFWAGFLDDPEPPWVIFSNAAFAGRPDIDMRYWDPKRDEGQPILDHYTGVGEVLAIHELDQLFNSFNHPLRVKRGRLLSLDDVKNNNLVFVGSPKENLTLRDVPSTSEFQFRTIEDGPRKGNVTVINMHPGPGESASYIASELPLSEDYAVAALVHGLNPAYHALILAGTTTMGTQAAVEYVCREQSVRVLMSKVSSPEGIRRFEALLHVTVKDGVPVSSELVALHLPKP
jgi:hypothetical protein